MSYRDHWKFTYSIYDLREAAVRKEAWHISRFEFWVEKKKETMAKIKSDGLEITESLANANNFSYSNISNTGRGAQVFVRNDLQQDLNEAEAKIGEHRNKFKDYHAWVSVFDSQPVNNQMELSKDDWLYFYGE